MPDNMRIVILAAGKGKRLAPLGYDVPKPLVPINGRPMLSYLIDAVKESGVDEKPIIVTAPDNHQMFCDELGSETCELVIQKKQLGTGHAVSCAVDSFGGAEHVMVLYGDHPTLSAGTIRTLADEHVGSGATLTMATVKFPDYNDWRQWFLGFGRIVRDDNGNIEKIVEKKDATEEQQNITEVNPGYYVFKAGWLCQNIDMLTNENAAGEYYITDLVEMAFEQEVPFHSMVVEDPIEGIGINTPEQLKAAEDALKERD